VVTYFISYVTRINYGAVIVDINKNTGIAQTALALAPTLSFITYGIGQLVSGFLGDKIQPKLLVFCGLIVTTLMNFFLPFCKTAGAMSTFWAVNGFAQAFMWPPIAKLMLSSMDGDEYKKQIQKVLWGCMAATMFVYLISPLIVSVMNWKGVFWFSAITGALGIVYWLKACPIIALKGKEEKENIEKTERNNTPIIAVMAVLLFAIICMGALRDGVTTWLPSYVSEAFNLESESAILTGAVLPMFTMVCYSVTARLYKTKLKNPVLCAGVVFGLGFLASLVLYILTATSSSGIVASVTLAALLTGCMHGVNLILISMLPSYFKRRGKVSLITGILNCAVYVGSAASTYLFPLVASNGGWSSTVLIWLIIAAVGTLVCLATVLPWKKFEKTL
jgi:OPA family glycerol-3-phosphate transporter-like MFS transporter